MSVILEGALGCVERVPKRDVDVRMGCLFCSLAAHGYSAARYEEIDLDVERCALAAVSRRRFYDDVATCDPIMESLEMPDQLVDSRCHCGRRIEVPER